MELDVGGYGIWKSAGTNDRVSDTFFYFYFIFAFLRRNGPGQRQRELENMGISHFARPVTLRAGHAPSYGQEQRAGSTTAR